MRERKRRASFSCSLRMQKAKKPLKPSQREKKRYLVFELTSKQFNFEDVKTVIIKTCLRFLGEFGFEKTKLYIIKNLYKDDKGILRVTNKMVNDVKAALANVDKIANTEAKMKIIGVSGTIKKAKLKFLEV